MKHCIGKYSNREVEPREARCSKAKEPYSFVRLRPVTNSNGRVTSCTIEYGRAKEPLSSVEQRFSEVESRFGEAWKS